MSKDNREYLGDSVYVEYDEYHLQLYLDNGFGRHTVIYIEPEVLEALERYIKRVVRKEPE